MRGLDGLDRAAAEARAQVREAREALASSRAALSGGPARDAREAEGQLLALREAVTGDILALRGRFTGEDPAAARALRNVALTTSGTIAGVVGAGLMARSALRRRSRGRTMGRQAAALARALSEHALTAPVAAATPRRRRGRGMLVLTVLGVAAGAVVSQRRQAQMVDPDELWLPVQPVGPA